MYIPTSASPGYPSVRFSNINWYAPQRWYLLVNTCNLNILWNRWLRFSRRPLTYSVLHTLLQARYFETVSRMLIHITVQSRVTEKTHSLITLTCGLLITRTKFNFSLFHSKLCFRATYLSTIWLSGKIRCLFFPYSLLTLFLFTFFLFGVFNLCPSVFCLLEPADRPLETSVYCGLPSSWS